MMRGVRLTSGREFLSAKTLLQPLLRTRCPCLIYPARFQSLIGFSQRMIRGVTSSLPEQRRQELWARGAIRPFR